MGCNSSPPAARASGDDHNVYDFSADDIGVALSLTSKIWRLQSGCNHSPACSRSTKL